MKTMKVFRIELDDLGDEVKLSPAVPKHIMSGEDCITERICCCPTIMGCISSSQITIKVSGDKDKSLNSEYRPIKAYLYYADADVADIYQPSEDKLPDVFYTGELWIINKPYTFHKLRKYELRRHMNIPNSVYSRYAMTLVGEDEVLDRINSAVVYGSSKAFSFIERNPNRNIDTIKPKDINRYY